MSEALIVGVIRQAIETAVIVSLPMLAAGLTVGILISIFQTVTSIQDNVSPSYHAPRPFSSCSH